MGRSIGDRADVQDRERVIGDAVGSVLKHASRTVSGNEPIKSAITFLKKEALQVIPADNEDPGMKESATGRVLPPQMAHFENLPEA
ncbi:hypothetical protein HPB52_002958 [Rhipicephalus sanguineus]|uniref:Uncharacterized protein n=1 Tax=Rhipicephalus sanguineus TaxID=34632 RepID=A0A9D4SPR8_RHISA|nr:hypothetical protein HPB52_002958 [Rhipicephalus sanguineus]